MAAECEWWRLKAAGRKCGKKRGGAGAEAGALGAGARRLAVEKGPVLADTLMPSCASCPLRTCALLRGCRSFCTAAEREERAA